MPDQTARPNKPFESWVSDEAREHNRAAQKGIREGSKHLVPPEHSELNDIARKGFFQSLHTTMNDAQSDIEQHGRKPR